MTRTLVSPVGGVHVHQARDVVKHAKHPYTKGLIGSVPSQNPRGHRLAQIDLALPKGAVDHNVTIGVERPMPHSTRPRDSRSSVDTRSATRAGWLVVNWIIP